MVFESRLLRRLICVQIGVRVLEALIVILVVRIVLIILTQNSSPFSILISKNGLFFFIKTYICAFRENHVCFYTIGNKPRLQVKAISFTLRRNLLGKEISV